PRSENPSLSSSVRPSVEALPPSHAGASLRPWSQYAPIPFSNLLPSELHVALAPHSTSQLLRGAWWPSSLSYLFSSSPTSALLQDSVSTVQS
ncbi:hypothetical protein S83_004234, partial [Arachis hypogaea]